MKTELTRSGTCTPHMGIPRTFWDSDYGLLYNSIFVIFFAKKFIKVKKSDESNQLNANL